MQNKNNIENDVICTAVGSVFGPEQGIIGGSGEAYGHRQDTGFGGLPGNAGLPACYWHVGGDAEWIYGQFIIGNDGNVYCRIYQNHERGDHVAAESYNYIICIRGGQRGPWSWQLYPTYPDASVVLSTNFQSTGSINATQNHNGGVGAAWTSANLGQTIDSSWVNVGSYLNFVNTNPGENVGHAYIGGLGWYHVESPIYPSPRRFTFSAEFLPLEYYPASICTSNSGSFVSCDDPGHSLTMFASGAFRDIKNLHGEASSSDKGFIVNNSKQIVKMIKC